MEANKHYEALANMYLAAPINAFFEPRIVVTEAASEIEIDVQPKLFHAAQAVHGCSYFKMLDDAAFFAANSLESEFFVLTASFTTYFTRPVTEGVLRSVGTVVNRSKNQYIAEAVLYNNDKQVGRGNGIFAVGRTPLVDALGYSRQSA